MRALSASGPWYAGVLRERTLGQPPASDLNDNGSDGDSLAVVVVRASDGWVLFADTDGDGTLTGERPVHDFLVARETFGWHQGREIPPLTIAANFSETPTGPVLDLFFDTSAHGTHVAGIIAGRFRAADEDGGIGTQKSSQISACTTSPGTSSASNRRSGPKGASSSPMRMSCPIWSSPGAYHRRS